MERIIILSILIAQSLAAPSGCLEACNTYQTSSYRSQQRSSGYTDNANLGQVNVGHQNVLNSGYDRPGNWSEHNQYRTDGGHGQVHEERGQYVEGPKRVRFYKKNYTSSYSTGYGNGGAATTSDQLSGHTLQHQTRVPTGGYYDNTRISESQYGQTGGSHVVHQDHTYNRMHDTHVQSQTSGSESQRLEDFGVSSGLTQTAQHGVSGYDSRTSGGYGHSSGAESGNWHEVNSYKTDGGRGQVFEENGQYVTGPTKVRYYKKNYTSSYSTTGDQINDSVHLQELERRMQNMMRELQSEVQHSTHGTQRVGDMQVSESVNYGQRNEHGHISTDNTGQRLSQNLYVRGQPSDYATENHSSYEQTRHSYVTKHQPVPVATNPSANLVRVPLGGRNDYQRNVQESGLSHQQFIDEQRRAEQFNSHRSRVNENTAHNLYTQGTVQYPSSSGHVRQYEEHWSSGGGTGNVPIPNYSGAHGSMHHGQLQYGVASHNDEHSSQHSAQRHNTYVGHTNTYNPVYTTPPGNLVNGVIKLGHEHTGVDCTQEGVGHNHRMYKRSAKYGESNDMHPQEADDLNQAGEKYDDFSQKTTGNTGFEHEVQAPQRVIKIEFTPDGSHVPSEYTIPDLDIIKDQNLLNMLEEIKKTMEELEKVNSYEDLIRRNITFAHQSHQRTEQHQNVVHQQQVYSQYGQHTSNNFDSNNRMPDWPHTPGSTYQQSTDVTQQTSQNNRDQHTQYPYRTTTGTVYYPQTGDFTQGNDDLTQQTGGFDDFTQQTSDGLEFGQQTQDPYRPRTPSMQRTPYGRGHTQDKEDLTQQTSGGIEFGQQTQDPYKPRKPVVGSTPQSSDLTQQTGGFDDLTQQTSDDLDFGQQTQDPYRRRTPGSQRPSNSDLIQENEDLTQQTSSGLEFGQQTQDPYRPRKPITGNTPHSDDLTQQNDDLTQQTGGFDDLTQQTSGGFEFGQQTQDPYRRRKPITGNTPNSDDLTQKNDDLTQQTGGFDDLTQQTSGGFEFGQQTQDPYRPRKPMTGNTPHSHDLTQQNDDLTQQTGGFDDLTQQTSGGFEFGQQTQDPYRPRKPITGNTPHSDDLTQQNDDLTQQTGGFDDLTQQTSGGFEFGQQTQDPYRPRKPITGNTPHSDVLTQQNDDLTQQTRGFDDLTQQTSGGFEFGQQTQDPYRPRKPITGNTPHSDDLTQQNDDLTQQTGGFDDLTQQTSDGPNLSQQVQNPQRPEWPRSRRPPQSGDLTQQNEDLTQQTSGLEFGQQTYDPYKPKRPQTGNKPQSDDLTQQNDDLTQQTGQLDDLTQQNDDLTQQTGKLDDFTQQTSDGLEFGQQTQDPYRARKPATGNLPRSDDFTQQNDDLTQQTAGFDDMTQQSGHLEFGQQTQDPYRPRIPGSRNPPHSGDFTQQTSDFEFGQHTQGPYRTGRPVTGNKPYSSDLNQQNEDLTQQTGGFDDFTQISSGDLEFGQQTQNPYRPRRPDQNPHYPGDLTQQTSGGIEFGQQTQDPYMSRRPGTNIPPYSRDLTQEKDDLTQQTGGFDDLTHQTPSDLEFGQYPQNPYRPRNPSNPRRPGDFSQNNDDLTQQAGDIGSSGKQTSDLEFGQQPQKPINANIPGQLPRKPAPKPRPRYQQQYPNKENKTSDKVNEPVEINLEVDDDDVRTGQLGRGDQSLTNVKPKYDPASTVSPQKPDDKPGVQWHYDHNPDDLTNSEPGLSDNRHSINDNSMTQQTPEQPPVEQLGVKTSRRRNRQRPQTTYNPGMGTQHAQDMQYPSSWPSYPSPIDSGFGNTQKQSNNVDYGQIREDVQQQRQFTPVESKVEGKVEPRILEAYGGGPYDSERNGDVFHRVTPNPSVTIPPNLEGFEPWDIREKPKDFPTAPDVPTVQPLDMSTETVEDSTASTEKPPGFWGRLGTRITTGFDKAKEKVRGVFG